MGNIHYKQYITDNKLKLSESQLSEKWAIGVILVNKKIDKMGEEFKKALIDAQIPEIEAVNIDSVEEYKKKSEAERKSIAKKLKKVSELKKKEAESKKEEMFNLCKEKGIGKGANDPRCISHCNYIVSKAQKEAIDEIIKKTEEYLDDETKSALEKISDEREEQEKEGKDAEGKDLDNIAVPESSIPDEIKDNKDVFEELYEEDGEKENKETGEKEKFYKCKYKTPDEFKEKSNKFKDKAGKLVDISNEDKMKEELWPSTFYDDIDANSVFGEDYTTPWYGGKTLVLMPIDGLKDVINSDKGIFKSIVSGDDEEEFRKNIISHLKGEISIKSYPDAVLNAISKEEGDDLETDMAYIRYMLFYFGVSLGDKGNSYKELSFKEDNKDILEDKLTKNIFTNKKFGIFAKQDDANLFGGKLEVTQCKDEALKNPINIPKDKKAVKEDLQELSDATTGLLDSFVGDSNEKISSPKIKTNFIKLFNLLNRRWKTQTNKSVKFGEKQIKELYKTIFGNEDGKTYNDFVKTSMSESSLYVMNFADWLFEQENKNGLGVGNFDVEKAKKFFNDKDNKINVKVGKSKDKKKELIDAIKKILDEIQDLFDKKSEPELNNDDIFPSKAQIQKIDNILKNNKTLQK